MAKPDFSKTVALIVEDNDFIRLMLRKYLGDFGFREIFEAPNGTVAIKRLDKNPDIIICDINMAPGNGFDFAKHVRALPPPACEVPIIFLTGSAASKDVQEAINLSVNAYLVKPVTPEKLKEKIIALMTRKK